ncbi:MAG: tRNA 2-selenouridine(34) synthase MnmH, partial [Bacillota bacterium]|nr:tRNA 2-selenouridine(34) synthase MnmH [Bacillota bacterium]
MTDNNFVSQEHQTVFIPETISADYYVDVRSEKEYASGHISNAINLPILNDLERHEVGWLYKNASVEEAKMRGAMYGGSKIEQFVRTISAIHRSIGGHPTAENKSLNPDSSSHSAGRVIVYCARGGYRSKSVVSLLNSIGIPVLQLEGGYKAYRQFVLNRLKGPFPRFIGINGLTGSGKTYILHELQRRGEPTLDLEGAANHKGSTLGAIGTNKIQCVQQFENDLVSQLAEAEGRSRSRDLPPYCFIEMESRRIGKLTIPAPLYAAYHDEAQQIYIERSREQRV